jgi:hypothetical protein
VSFLNERSALMSRSHHTLLDLAAGPPPEVLDEIDAAWERAQALLGGRLELHFKLDDDLQRVWGELRRPEGTLEQRLYPSEALAVACGDPVDLRASVLAV